ncbi:galactosyltransferase-related protein [Aeromonas sp. sif0611]|uniref:galactosyltransferase-related protein n=1 Tax=Aeromonas sp. sif0611 TaxID=2854787 RepID=UPI00210C25C5|nr:galactosyltransferase-related protein [Aeromonas sp. sif0611]
MINIITPFYHASNRGEISSSITRLSNAISSLSPYEQESIYITSNIKEILSKHGIVSRVLNFNRGDFSPGVARNEAIKSCGSKYIFIFDADLMSQASLIIHIQSLLSQPDYCRPPFFEMYPCLYLTKEETERFDGDFQGCLESFLRGENHRVEGIALASSCLLMNREWFLQLGGFDEQFVGHGGEDLELIDRLTRHYPIGPRPDDYALNIKAQHPGDYQGFRRYFSYYALPHLFAGRFLVHQWHPRPLTHPYHKRRAGNDQLLEQMLSRSEAERGPLKGPVVPCNDLNGELPDFREWMIRLQEEAGYPVSEYPGLLRWQDGITLRRPLWRKVRKLYLNPRAFFRDMFKPTSR